VGVTARRWVVFAQDHDQVGNRIKGDRLSTLVGLEALKLAAGVVLLSPFVPLLFMGEEYGETAPFLYFVSHSDPELVEAVRRGRKEEFEGFQWSSNPPDPQDEETFLSAKINHELAGTGHHRVIYEFYKELIRLRKTLPASASTGRELMEISDFDPERTLCVRRGRDLEEAVTIFNFSQTASELCFRLSAGKWIKSMDSAESRWKGPGSAVPSEVVSDGEIKLRLNPYSVVLFTRDVTS
jgi:maltooligosyltrehalose trehalohydrolase